MNKFALVLIFSFIAFTKGTLSFDDFNTEPYHSFDWLDKDEKTFLVKLKAEASTNTFCYLYNTSKVCKPDCPLQDKNKTISCTLKGDNCKADADNPAFKYYYAVYCSESTTANYNKSAAAGNILASSNVGSSSDDVGVTIAVCSGSYLKYSLFLLSLLIL